MTIKLLHTADWQIGKGFANFEGDAGALLRTQRVKTVERIAQIAIEKDVDAILVAGDLFETNTVTDETLRRTLGAMKAFGKHWVLLPGNHDAALADSVWARLPQLGMNTNISLALAPEPITLLDGRLAVLPGPLRRRHEPNDVTEWYDAAATPSGAFRVGLAHGSVANRLPPDAVIANTISDTRSDTAKLDYLALGDWHGVREINPHTWYSGTPEPDRFPDNDPGNVIIVTLVEPGGSPSVEIVPCGFYHWQKFVHVISDENGAQALDAVFSAVPDESRLVANLKLEGVVDLATRQQVENVIDRHRAQCHYLRVDDDELVAVPSDADLDRIDTMGFVRSAIDQLKAKAGDPGDHESAIARAALQKLYLEHIRLGTP